jgi:hypothetical protein
MLIMQIQYLFFSNGFFRFCTGPTGSCGFFRSISLSILGFNGINCSSVLYPAFVSLWARSSSTGETSVNESTGIAGSSPRDLFWISFTRYPSVSGCFGLVHFLNSSSNFCSSQGSGLEIGDHHSFSIIFSYFHSNSPCNTLILNVHPGGRNDQVFMFVFFQ